MGKVAPKSWLGVAFAALGLSLAVSNLRVEKQETDTGDPKQPAATRTKSNRNEIILGTSREKRSAVVMIAAEPESMERNQQLSDAIRQWAVVAPDAAMAWIRHLPPDETRDWLVCAVITETASNDENKAVAMLNDQLWSAGLPWNHAVVAIAQRWAEKSPGKARAWVEQIAEPCAAREDALREIAAIAHAASQ